MAVFSVKDEGTYAASPSIIRLDSGRLLSVLERSISWGTNEDVATKLVFASDNGGLTWAQVGTIHPMNWPQVRRSCWRVGPGSRLRVHNRGSLGKGCTWGPGGDGDGGVRSPCLDGTAVHSLLVSGMVQGGCQAVLVDASRHGLPAPQALSLALPCPSQPLSAAELHFTTRSPSLAPHPADADFQVQERRVCRGHGAPLLPGQQPDHLAHAGRHGCAGEGGGCAVRCGSQRSGAQQRLDRVQRLASLGVKGVPPASAAGAQARLILAANHYPTLVAISHRAVARHALQRFSSWPPQGNNKNTPQSHPPATTHTYLMHLLQARPGPPPPRSQVGGAWCLPTRAWT